MASNIRVVLEVDNKKYLADIRQADQATKDFARTASNLGGASFDKLNGAVNAVHARMVNLKTVVAGALFAGLGQSTIAMADQMNDLSAATGIALARIIEFRKAFIGSGGEADALPQALTTFVRSIDEAAQGSLKAQNTFKSLGVSLKELGTLSEEALLEETLEGIIAIEDSGRRAATMMDIFGKSFRLVNPQDLLDKLRAARGEGDKYAESLRRAADLQDAFDTASGNLKLALLEAFSPALKLANDFAQAVRDGKASMDALIASIKLAGIALAVAFSSSVLLGFVASIGVVLRGISAIGVALGATALPAWLIAASGAAARFLPALRAIALLFSGGLGIYAATKAFDNFGDIATNAISRIIEAIGRLTGELLNLPTDGLAKLLNLLPGVNIENATGLGTPFLIAAENARKAREEMEKTFAAQKARTEFAATDPRRVDLGGAGTAAPATGGREVTDALAKRRKEIETSAESFKRYNNQIIDTINFENSLIGKNEDQVAVMKAVEEVYSRAATESQKLRDAKAALSADEAELAATYDAQIRKIQEASEVDAERIRKATENANGLKLIERSRLADIENLTRAMEAQQRIQDALASSRLSIISQGQDVEFARAQAGRSPIERQIADIRENARKAALEAGRALAAAFEDGGDGLSPERAQQFADGLRAIEEGYRAIADAQTANLETSRTWEAGWRDAFNNYKDSAQNAADQARTYFETFTRGFEDAIVRFVQTGKLSFKDLANSLIADFVRIQAKKIALNLFGGEGNPLSSIFGGFRAAGGPVSANVPYIVGEKGPEMFVPRNAGTIIPNNKLSQQQPQQTNVTYNIQAVDAASFRQMVARDPEFLYAVTERGRSSIPGGRR